MSSFLFLFQYQACEEASHFSSKLQSSWVRSQMRAENPQTQCRSRTSFFFRFASDCGQFKNASPASHSRANSYTKCQVELKQKVVGFVCNSSGFFSVANKWNEIRGKSSSLSFMLARALCHCHLFKPLNNFSDVWWLFMASSGRKKTRRKINACWKKKISLRTEWKEDFFAGVRSQAEGMKSFLILVCFQSIFNVNKSKSWPDEGFHNLRVTNNFFGVHRKRRSIFFVLVRSGSD